MSEATRAEGAPPGQRRQLSSVQLRSLQGDDPVAASRQLRLAKWLVSQGFDPRETYTTAPGEDGEADSARVSAGVKKEYLEAFKLLLRHGANPDVPGKDGRTVREIAARKNDRRYVSTLPPDGVDAEP